MVPIQLNNGYFLGAAKQKKKNFPGLYKLPCECKTKAFQIQHNSLTWEFLSLQYRWLPLGHTSVTSGSLAAGRENTKAFLRGSPMNDDPF